MDEQGTTEPALTTGPRSKALPAAQKERCRACHASAMPGKRLWAASRARSVSTSPPAPSTPSQMAWLPLPLTFLCYSGLGQPWPGLWPGPSGAHQLCRDWTVLGLHWGGSWGPARTPRAPQGPGHSRGNIPSLPPTHPCPSLPLPCLGIGPGKMLLQESGEGERRPCRWECKTGGHWGKTLNKE